MSAGEICPSFASRHAPDRLGGKQAARPKSGKVSMESYNRQQPELIARDVNRIIHSQGLGGDAHIRA